MEVSLFPRWVCHDESRLCTVSFSLRMYSGAQSWKIGLKSPASYWRLTLAAFPKVALSTKKLYKCHFHTDRFIIYKIINTKISNNSHETQIIEIRNDLACSLARAQLRRTIDLLWIVSNRKCSAFMMDNAFNRTFL